MTDDQSYGNQLDSGDHELTYLAVQQVHEAFVDFSERYLERLTTRTPEHDSDEFLVGLHLRYVQKYLASAGRDDHEPSRSSHPSALDLPEFSPEPEDLPRRPQAQNTDTSRASAHKRSRPISTSSRTQEKLKHFKSGHKTARRSSGQTRMHQRKSDFACHVLVNRPHVQSRNASRRSISADALWAAHWRVIALRRRGKYYVGRSPDSPISYLQKNLQTGKAALEKRR